MATSLRAKPRSRSTNPGGIMPGEATCRLSTRSSGLLLMSKRSAESPHAHLVTANVYPLCLICRRRAEPAHVLGQHVPSRLYCVDCCPACKPSHEFSGSASPAGEQSSLFKTSV